MASTSRAKAPNGKIVIVFGASRGLGKGIAIGLAKEVRHPNYLLSARMSGSPSYVLSCVKGLRCWCGGEDNGGYHLGRESEIHT